MAIALKRRAFLGALFAAPFIVRPGILMPIRPLDDADRFAGRVSWHHSLDGNSFELTSKDLQRLHVYTERVHRDPSTGLFQVERTWKSFDPRDPSQPERIDKVTREVIANDPFHAMHQSLA